MSDSVASFCWIEVAEKEIPRLKVNSYVKAQTFPMSQKYMMTMDEDEYNETFGEKKGFIVSTNHKSISDIVIYDTTQNKEVFVVPATCKMTCLIYKLKKKGIKRKLPGDAETSSVSTKKSKII